jgi:hypothetical protein
MKFRSLALSAVALTLANVGLSASPASAVAQCPDKHVCFYKDYGWTGTMSDQTNALAHDPLRPYYLPAPQDFTVNGKIEDMHNSNYTNGDVLNDSISSVHNFSDQCVVLWADVYYRDFTGTHDLALTIGPHTSVDFKGTDPVKNVPKYYLYNDRMSSAYTTQNERCQSIGWGNWEPGDPPRGIA